MSYGLLLTLHLLLPLTQACADIIDAVWGIRRIKRHEQKMMNLEIARALPEARVVVRLVDVEAEAGALAEGCSQAFFARVREVIREALAAAEARGHRRGEVHGERVRACAGGVRREHDVV